MDLAIIKNSPKDLIHLLSLGWEFKLKRSSGLLLAGRNGYQEILEILLAAGYDSEIDEALVLASTHGHFQTVQTLIRADPSVDALNYALILGSKSGHVGIVELLSGTQIFEPVFLKRALEVTENKKIQKMLISLLDLQY